MSNQFDRSVEMDVKKFWNVVLGQGADPVLFQANNLYKLVLHQ